MVDEPAARGSGTGQVTCQAKYTRRAFQTSGKAFRSVSKAGYRGAIRQAVERRRRCLRAMPAHLHHNVLLAW